MLKIWNEESKNEINEDQLFFKLIQDEWNNINLCVCDKNGERIDRGTVLVICNESKCIYTISYLTEKANLKTDCDDEPLVYDNGKLDEIRTKFFMRKQMELHQSECVECQSEEENKDSETKPVLN